MKEDPLYLFFFKLLKAKYYKRLNHKQLPTIQSSPISTSLLKYV